MSIQALREEKATIGAKVKALVDKPKWDAATDQPVYDTAMAEIDAIETRIKASVFRVERSFPR